MSQSTARILLLVLVLVLPLRLLAAGVVPIIGMPGHDHQPANALQSGQTAGTIHEPRAHEGCAAHASEIAAPADSVHEHGCPHLGMASMSAPDWPLALADVSPGLAAHGAVTFVSVVLAVPSPPPTALL